MNWKKYEWDSKNEKYPDLKSGDLLHLNDGRIILVGDVDKLLGYCGHCMLIDYSDIAQITNVFDEIKRLKNLIKI